MKTIGDIIQFVINMGASVMLPIVIALLSAAMGVRIGKAIRSGLMIGVGFVGLSLLIEMMNDQLGPAASAMSENFGLSLNVVDIGWPGASPLTWASDIAAVAIPVAIAVNLAMIFFKMTKTVNIDIWNIWHMTFTGAIACAVTGSYAVGVLGVAVHAAVAYKLGDLWAPMIGDYFDLEGITVPHGTAAYMGPVACVFEYVLDRIPGINRIDISADTLQEKIGVLGEPIVIGGLLGMIVGFLAGYGPGEALPLGIQMSAVMVLMPKVVKCIMDGLVPLSERARQILSRKFGDSDFYIGLDPAVLLGDSQVITTGLLFIPLTILIAVIVPGNSVLPFGDLVSTGFFVAIACAVHKGNIFRTLISGSAIMFMTFWIANQTIPWVALLIESTGMAGGTGQLTALDQGGCPITYVYTQIFERSNPAGMAVIAAVYGFCLIFAVRLSKKRAEEIKGMR